MVTIQVFHCCPHANVHPHATSPMISLHLRYHPIHATVKTMLPFHLRPCPIHATVPSTLLSHPCHHPVHAFIPSTLMSSSHDTILSTLPFHSHATIPSTLTLPSHPLDSPIYSTILSPCYCPIPMLSSHPQAAGPGPYTQQYHTLTKTGQQTNHPGYENSAMQLLL